MVESRRKILADKLLFFCRNSCIFRTIVSFKLTLFEQKYLNLRCRIRNQIVYCSYKNSYQNGSINLLSSQLREQKSIPLNFILHFCWRFVTNEPQPFFSFSLEGSISKQQKIERTTKAVKDVKKGLNSFNQWKKKEMSEKGKTSEVSKCPRIEIGRRVKAKLFIVPKRWSIKYEILKHDNFNSYGVCT